MDRSDLTADGVAGVAVRLALNSQLLHQKHDLVDAFWCFFDILAAHITHDQEHEAIWQAYTQLALEFRDSYLGKIPRPLYTLIHAAYKRGDYDKPIEELTDRELLVAKGIGLSRLGKIREIVPMAKLAPKHRGTV
jgi:hypothetical protein